VHPLTQTLLGVLAASASAATAFAQGTVPDRCAPQYAFFGDNQGVMRPREIDPCVPPEVVKAADALGMVRYSPPTVKSVVTAQWEASGTIAMPGATNAPHNASRVRIGISYAVPAIRLEFEGAGADGKPVAGVYVAAGKYAWNETKPGIGATPASAGAVDERLPLIWLTPYGAIWAAVDGNPARRTVTQSGGKTVIASSIDGFSVVTTLNAENRPEHVAVQTGRGAYEARYSDYFDPDEYRVMVPRRMEWTMNGRPLADLKVTGYHANMYVVFPVPASIKGASGK
jgi:hypothetical protein